VLGKRLTVNGQELAIIGVAPQGFTGTNLGTRPNVFVPLTLRWAVMNQPAAPEERRVDFVYLFGRLKLGVSAEQAAAQLNGLFSGILDEVEAPLLSGLTLQPGTLERFRAKRIVLSPGAQGQGNIRETAARPLALLLAVTTLVLLIVCVNIANLLLARGAARGGEMAIRASIGASRGVLVRQLLAESLVLIAMGGALSLVVARLVVRLIAALLPDSVANGLAPELSSSALLFAAATSLLTVLVFGLAPAWRVSGTNPAQAMSQHARGSGGRAAVRFRGVLTTAQIAFSMVLLVLAGLFTRSLVNVAREDLGMDVDSVVSFAVTPKQNAYDAQRLAVLYDRIEESVAAQPGVLGVGSTGVPLLSNFVLGGGFAVEGVEMAPGADNFAALNIAGSGYFDALGVPLLAGRAFTDRDTNDAPPVVIVNESFVRKFELGGDAVGKRVAQPGPQGAVRTFELEIVGVVADAKLGSVKGEAPAIVYFPRHQLASAIEAMFYYVRTDFDPAALVTTIPRLVAAIDPNVPVSGIRTMRTVVNANVYIDRLLTTLSAGFAALATLLAGIGLYGVLAYNVTQRTRELGLRLALGAAPTRLRALVLKQVGVMALIGAGAGLVAALALGRVAEAVLFGLSGRDPLVIAAAVAVLGAVVLAGAWLPARRASRIAPTEALRYE
jgi:predicted permease